MKSCIYPGSFDPVTTGHIDIINRAAALYDTVYVAVLNSAVKKYMYTAPKRLDMVKKAADNMKNLEVVAFDGLLTELMRKLDTRVILRGLRSGYDLEMEQQMAAANAKLLPGTETVMLFALPDKQYVSSTIVRELITFKADLTGYIPDEILDMIRED